MAPSASRNTINFKDYRVFDTATNTDTSERAKNHTGVPPTDSNEPSRPTATRGGNNGLKPRPDQESVAVKCGAAAANGSVSMSTNVTEISPGAAAVLGASYRVGVPRTTEHAQNEDTEGESPSANAPAPKEVVRKRRRLSSVCSADMHDVRGNAAAGSASPSEVDPTEPLVLVYDKAIDIVRHIHAHGYTNFRLRASVEELEVILNVRVDDHRSEALERRLSKLQPTTLWVCVEIVQVACEFVVVFAGSGDVRDDDVRMYVLLVALQCRVSKLRSPPTVGSQ